MSERFPNSNGDNEYRGSASATPEAEASRERQPQLNPRIYVTAGLPLRAELTTGTWLDMARDPREIYAELSAVLGDPIEHDVDGFYIWDYQDFGGFKVTTGAIGLEGVHSVELLSQVAQGVAEHGPAFAAWASAHEDEPGQFDRFKRAYKGHFDSLAAYVRTLFVGDDDSEQRLRLSLPPRFHDYGSEDYEEIGEYLADAWDLVAFPANEHGVWIFDERAS